MGVSSVSVGLAMTGVEVLNASDNGNEVDNGVVGKGVVAIVIGVVGSCCCCCCASPAVGAASTALVSIKLVTEADAP